MTTSALWTPPPTSLSSKSTRVPLAPLLRQMRIKTKDLRIEPLDLNSAFARSGQRPFIATIQQRLNAGVPVRAIVLKARQLGISTVSEALLFNWCFMFKGAESLVLSK